jgi:hypothetical protein
VDAEALLDLRSGLDRELAGRADGLKVSVNDLIVKACAGLLRANPDLNVSFGGDKLLVHRRVHVGIAVAVEGGLVVPVIRDADGKALTQVAREARELAGKARAGKLDAVRWAGGRSRCRTWGCSGPYRFTTVINPPEAAILAVGAAVSEPVATETGASRSGGGCGSPCRSTTGPSTGPPGPVPGPAQDGPGAAPSDPRLAPPVQDPELGLHLGRLDQQGSGRSRANGTGWRITRRSMRRGLVRTRCSTSAM